ncbi:hypothetical protein CmeUKMEL1_17660 [Cryptosporidium meleagridis]|uniref:Uncharacterized protein n=1 Tax=Cryptosporidium meleagridis TaxID=93969 RepID=A0A2P4Z679_9CRYT|nr:hypothetical protein CmeUKMEL1_17660 [Cryptosporidium meleagridis]
MKNYYKTNNKIPRRYSLTNSEKTTLGKSLLRYIQVSHYFEKPTVRILNENVRNDLINKQKEEIERTDLEKSIKDNEKKIWREINHKLEECIDERVNLRSIDKQKNWLKKMVDEDLPEIKTSIERKISFGKNNHESANHYNLDGENSDIEENNDPTRGKNDIEIQNIHIKSEKGFPFLNFQYNNVEETVIKWNPPSINNVLKERDFTRKLRVIRKGESIGTNNHARKDEIDENIEICKYDDETRSEMDSDNENQSSYGIPVIGEQISEHELKEKFKEEDNIYLRQYLNEIKCDTNIIDFVKEKHNYKKFKKWLKKNKLKLKNKKIISEDSYVSSKDNIFHSSAGNSDQDDEARDLHTRNDFRRFDILFDSNLFGYCDYDETDNVLDGIIEQEKSKRKNLPIDQADIKDINNDTQLKEKFEENNNKVDNQENYQDKLEDDNNNNSDIDKTDSDNSESEDSESDDSESDDSESDKKEGKSENEAYLKKMENLKSALLTGCSKNTKKKENTKNGTDSSHFNRMLNMLLNAGAEIDDDDEKIIKEERREEQNLGRLRMPKTVNRLGNLNNNNYTESLEEYYEKKRNLRIYLRSKILKEYKNEKEYSLELFYNNPVMLQSFIKKMDNQISEEKKKYENEQSERLHLSYKLKFLIEKNAHLNCSINKAEEEINILNNAYIDKTEYINNYLKRLEEELSGLEKLQSIIINSLGMLSQWCVCEPEYLDPKCTKNWEKSSIALVPGGRPSHALLICKRICHFDSRLSKLYRSMYLQNYKVGLKILKRRAALNNEEKINKLENKDDNHTNESNNTNNNHEKDDNSHLKENNNNESDTKTNGISD